MDDFIKIIFLDIDGVLIPVNSKMGSIFNMRNIDNLNELTKKTGAKIVISSDWKLKHDIEFLKKYLFDNGVRGEIIDITPNYTIKENDTIKVPRGIEVESWITNYNSFDGEKLKAVTNYVILDDHFDFLLSQSDNFIHIDQTKGFDSKDLKNAVQILNYFGL